MTTPLADSGRESLQRNRRVVSWRKGMLMSGHLGAGCMLKGEVSSMTMGV